MSQSLHFASANEELRPEISAAYREAKARGLPDGWTCTIDVSFLLRKKRCSENNQYLTYLNSLFCAETQSPQVDSSEQWQILRFYPKGTRHFCRARLASS